MASTLASFEAWSGWLEKKPPNVGGKFARRFFVLTPHEPFCFSYWYAVSPRKALNGSRLVAVQPSCVFVRAGLLPKTAEVNLDRAQRA